MKIRRYNPDQQDPHIKCFFTECLDRCKSANNEKNHGNRCQRTNKVKYISYIHHMILFFIIKHFTGIAVHIGGDIDVLPFSFLFDIVSLEMGKEEVLIWHT